MKTKEDDFRRFREIILREKRMVKELSSLQNYIKNAEEGDKKMILSQIALLKKAFKRTNEEIPRILDKITLIRKLHPDKIEEDLEIKEKRISPKKILNVIRNPSSTKKGYTLKDLRPTGLEKETIKRMRKKESELKAQKEKKPSMYVSFANRWFSDYSEKIVYKKTFQDLERDLIKANLQFTPRSYISVIFLTTILAFFVGFFIALFFLFFNIGVALPIITRVTEEFSSRWWKSFLVFILSPMVTFVIMYIYPNLEKSAAEARIEEELPFATIHMSAISGSMIDPSKIFDIMISTQEYPAIEKEFKKLINSINLYGYDLVSALRNSAYNSPSKKLSELFNGLATTINSGGFLPEFFEKRSQTLLFENSLEQEKKTKSAETFMDMYISIVIAAPMILMILLIMMKISGLGISMSTSTITIIMVLAVTAINIVFLTFLQLKR